MVYLSMNRQSNVTVIINTSNNTSHALKEEQPTKNLALLLFKSLLLKEPYPFADFYLKEKNKVSESKFMLSPISLVVGMRDILLQALPDKLAITENEYQHIKALVEPHLLDEGYTLHLNEGQFIVCGEINMISTPLFNIEETSVREALPRGEDKIIINRLIAELQMLLNQAAFNIERVNNGKVPINALWVWGEGQWAASTLKVTLLTDNGYLKYINKNSTLFNALSKEVFLDLKKNYFF